MPTAATAFREYLRGRTPPDFTDLWTPGSWTVAAYEGDPYRDTWVRADYSGGLPTLLAWRAPDGDVGHGEQEIEFAVQTVGTGLAFFEVAYLRAAGAVGAESGYAVAVDLNTSQVKIFERAAGIATLKATGAVAGLLPARLIRGRFQAHGTTVRARLWLDGAAEPGTWPASVTLTSRSDGDLGVTGGGTQVEIHFVSYGTNGEAAPGPATIPAGLATWSAQDPSSAVEMSIEIEGYDPADGSTVTRWYSTLGRFTGPGDWPAGTDMPPNLTDPGTLTGRLTSDILYSGRSQDSLGTATLSNLSGYLNSLGNLYLSGRRVTVRIGLASWRQHRWFDIYYTAILDGNPPVQDDVALAFKSPYADLEELRNPQSATRIHHRPHLLDEKLAVKRHVGIPVGLKINSGAHLTAHLAAYDLTSFAVAFRFRFSAPPVAHACGLQKASSSTAEQFSLFIVAGGGQVAASASCAGAVRALYMQSPLSYTDDDWHWAGLIVDGTNPASLLVDGEVLLKVAPPSVVDQPAVAITLGTGFSGQQLCDCRFYGYAPDPVDLIASMAAVSEGDDIGLLSCWIAIDVAGGTATDVGPLANHVTLGGSIGVAYDWKPTDLGDAGLAGQAMQRVFGNVVNAKATLIDKQNQRFRIHDSEYFDGLHHLRVRSQGEVIATWSTGGGGVIAFPTVQSEPITYDTLALDDRSFMRLNAVLAALFPLLSLSEAAYDPEALAILGTIAPVEVGYYAGAGQEPTGAQALDELLGKQMMHYRIDRDGRIVPTTLLPTVTPGPFAGEAVLELLGHGGGGIKYGIALNLPASFTIAGWVKPFNGAAGPLIFGNYDAGTGVGQVQIRMSSTHPDCLEFYMPGVTGTDFRTGLPTQVLRTGDGDVPYGQWTFFSATYDSSGVGARLLFIGTTDSAARPVDSQTSLTGAMPGTGSLLGIGSGLAGAVQHLQVRDGTMYFNADVEGLRVTNPPLPTVSGSVGPCHLVFYEPLTEGFGTTVTDQIGSLVGKIGGGRWQPQLIADFFSALSGSTFDVKFLRPAWEVVARWGRNRTPMVDADISPGGGVSATESAALKRDWQSASASDPRVLDGYPDARGTDPLSLDSPLMQRADAKNLAKNGLDRFSPGHLQASLNDLPRAALALIPGSEVWVYHPRLGNSQAATFRVVGHNTKLASLRRSLDLWGVHLPEPEALVDDFGRPIVTDAGTPVGTG